MFDHIMKLFKKFSKEEKQDSKDTAKERLHLVLMQDRANVSADFMELMKQEIIEVIKKYIDVDENLIDVKLTNKVNNDGTTGAPMLYANIPILNVKDDTKQINIERKQKEENHQGDQKEEVEENTEEEKEQKIEETAEVQEIIEKEENLEESIEGETIVQEKEENPIEQKNENSEQTEVME